MGTNVTALWDRLWAKALRTVNTTNVDMSSLPASNPGMDIPERIGNRILIEATAGHWLWQGPTARGRAWVRPGGNRPPMLLQRYLWEQLTGLRLARYQRLIPTCNLESCVAPRHRREEESN